MTLPTVGCPGKLWEESRNPKVTLTELQKYSVDMGEPARIATISVTLHKSDRGHYPLGICQMALSLLITC